MSVSLLLKFESAGGRGGTVGSKSEVWNHFSKSVVNDVVNGLCHVCKKTFKCLWHDIHFESNK